MSYYPPIFHNTDHVPRILQLHAEIGGMFADQMDLLTLTKWRLTCKANYHQTSAALRRTLMTNLRPFVPSPTILLNIVTKFHAIFGGECALSFILRDPSYKPDVLEIFSSEHEFNKLCDALLDDKHIRDLVVDHNITSSTLFFALRRLIAQTLTIHLFNKKIIYVHRSYTASAAAPLTRAPCTALSNFVTAYSFGCSHPILTIQRQALLADQEIPYLPKTDATTLNNLLKHQFTMAVSPAAWPEFRRTVPPKDGPCAPTAATSHAAMSIGTFVAADEETLTHGSVITDTEFALSIDLAHLYGDMTDGSVEADDDPQTLAHIPDPDLPDVDSPSFDNESPRVVQPVGVEGEQSPLGDVATDVLPATAGEGYVDAGSVERAMHPGSLLAGEDGEQSRIGDVATDVLLAPAGEGYVDAGSVERAMHPGSLLAGEDGEQSRIGDVATDILLAPAGEGYVDAGSVERATHPGSLLAGEDGEQSRIGDVATDVLLAPAGEGYVDAGSVERATHPGSLLAGEDGEQSRIGDVATDVLLAPAGEGYVDAGSVERATHPVAQAVGADGEQPRFGEAGTDIVIQCWRDRYICPSQGRYFGDKGSFVGFLDPLRGDETQCVDNNIAPYGPMVVWRIMSTFDCEEGCEYFDDVLEEGVTSIPVLFKKDPYGELRDVVSDRCMSQFGRRRALNRQRSRSM